jgi:hypothetical protein
MLPMALHYLAQQREEREAALLPLIPAQNFLLTKLFQLGLSIHPSQQL